MKYIFSSNKIFEVFPDHLHSYLNVYLRYLAFAFETLHYPWIPSLLPFQIQIDALIQTTFCVQFSGEASTTIWYAMQI